MTSAIDAAFGMLRKPVVRLFSGAMFTQGLLSMTNFIVGVCVAKYADKNEYGIYVLLFSTIGMVGSYQNALVNNPLTVLVNKKEPIEKALFVSGLGFAQWLFFFPIVIVAMIVGLMYSLSHKDFTIIKYVLIVLLVSSTYLVREFLRTVNYAKLRIQFIVKMDVIFVLSVVLGLGILVGLKKVTGSISIGILGIGYFLPSLFGYVYAGDMYVLDWGSMKGAIRETWAYSKWAIISVSSYMLQNRGYIYILSAALGLQELADISAARLFFMPLGLIIDSSGKMILAKGAEVLNVEGLRRFKKFVLSITGFLMLLGALYGGLLWFIHPVLITSVLGDKYANLSEFIFLWGIYFFIYSLRFPINSSLMVCGEFKALAGYDVLGAILTCATCLILVGVIKGSGAIMALAMGELVLLSLNAPKLLGYFKKKRREMRAAGERSALIPVDD
jgi:O-antigen/teichoic acid export membrane protein